MALMDSVFGAIGRAGLENLTASTSSQPAYGSDLYQGQGESLYDYLQRLRGTRKGGILGGGGFGGGGMFDTPKQAEVNASDELGRLIRKQTESSGPSDYENALGIPDPRYTSASAGMIDDETLLRQKLGLDFDPALIFGAFNPLLGYGVTAARDAEIRDRLRAYGYSDEAIDALMADKRLLGSAAYNDMQVGDKEFRIGDVGGGGLLGGISDWLLGVSPANTATAYAQARAADPSLFGTALNQSAAYASNPIYLGTNISSQIGFTDNGNLFTTSTGQTYDTSNMSNEAKTGLAITQATQSAGGTTTGKATSTGYNPLFADDYSAPSYSSSSSTGGDWTMNSSGTGYTTSSGQSVSFDLSRD